MKPMRDGFISQLFSTCGKVRSMLENKIAFLSLTYLCRLSLEKKYHIHGILCDLICDTLRSIYIIHMDKSCQLLVSVPSLRNHDGQQLSHSDHITNGQELKLNPIWSFSLVHYNSRYHSRSVSSHPSLPTFLSHPLSHRTGWYHLATHWLISLLSLLV